MLANIQELQKLTLTLSHDDLFRFSQWFEEFMTDQWDKKIEADVEAGRFDKLAEQVDKDFLEGRVKSL